MIDIRRDIPESGKALTIALGLLAIAGIIWLMSNSIAAGNFKGALVLIAAIGVCAVAGKTLSDWRKGLYLFLVWLLFEDLIRKYLGNNMLVYFGKDALVGVTYMAFVMARLRGEIRERFRPPFKYALGMFVLLGLAQVFNSGSPSLWYGVMGMKLYYYYIPLMFVSYALVRTERDLQNFLFVNAGLAAVIALVGILQSIIGLDFLNPHSGEDLELLGHLVRMTPSGLLVPRPPSVFVSDARFAWYLIVAMPLILGTAGYLLLRTQRGRKLVFPALGLVAVGATVSGSRGGFAWVVGSAVIVPVAMLWGAPPKFGEGYRLIKAIRRSFIFVAFAVALATTLFPQVIGARLSLYRETILPDSPDSESVFREWNYPVQSFLWVFYDRDWPIGHGIGTASLGGQYVSRIMGAPPMSLFSESGVGVLIIELGILGPILWVVWAVSLIFTASRVVFRLKGTWAFPVAFSILWYIFVLLIPITWTGINTYQNFVNNAYLWLLVGVLFRLPLLVADSPVTAEELHGKSTLQYEPSTADRDCLAIPG